MGVLLAFVIITISYINAQDYVMLDETDLNTWEADDESYIPDAEKTINHLCDNFYLIINNDRIDCGHIQLIPKELLDQNNHVIRKRDAGETDLEGSGDSDPTPLEPKILSSNVSNVNQENAADKLPFKNVSAAEIPQENKDNAGVHVTNSAEKNNNTKVETALNSNDTKTAELEIPKVEDENIQSMTKTIHTKDVTTETPIEITPTRIPNPQNYQKSDAPLVHKISEESNSTQQKFESTVAPEISTIVLKLSTVTAATESKSDSPIILEKEIDNSTRDSNKDEEVRVSKGKTIILEKEVDNSTRGSNKDEEVKVSKVLPSDLTEVDSLNNQKELESVNDHQSGNAVLFKLTKMGVSSSVEGSESDKALKGMNEKAKITNESSDQPTSGESAKDVSKAGKDTTILIVLFVVVIVIGGAAFTHNFIKKRKQNQAASNDLVNGIRRSLQNLSSSNGAKNTTDVEQGTELKPLMKNPGPMITKEFKDTRNEVPA